MAANRKIAIVDLDTRQIEITPIPLAWRQKFIGGRGLGTYLACRYATPGCDSLASGNPVVISAGLLAGTLSGPSANTSIITQSPLSGYLESALLPGSFAAEMRWAGFDHLVITGRAQQWVCLSIHNGTLEILDARKLKGCGIDATCRQLRRTHGDGDLKTLAIGPAGETCVRFATLADGGGRTAGRTGMGAVLGSKKIKALACRGTLDIEIKYPDKAIAHRLATAVRHPAAAGERSGDMTFRELAAANSFGEQGPAFNAHAVDLGLDPQAVWFMAKLATGQTAGDPVDRLPELAGQIARRQGKGDELAEGPLRTAGNERLGEDEKGASVASLAALFRETPPFEGHGAAAFHAPRKSGATYRGKPGTVAHRDLSLRLLDCLGDRTCAGICPDTGRLDRDRVAELIGVNIGTGLKPETLPAAAYRCYALERLYNFRAEKAARQAGRLDECLLVPGSIRMDAATWARLDLPALRKAVAQYYRANGWERKSIVKKRVFEKLGVEALWPQLK